MKKGANKPVIINVKEQVKVEALGIILEAGDKVEVISGGATKKSEGTRKSFLTVEKILEAVRNGRAKKREATAEKLKGARCIETVKFKKYEAKPVREGAMKSTTIEAIKRALVDEINADYDDIEYTGESQFGRGFIFECSSTDSDESEWVVFASEDDAENEALDYVKDMLEDEPESFNSDFLENHIYITSTDKRLISKEEADSRVENYDDEEICEEAGKSSDYSDLQDKIDEANSREDDLTGEEDDYNKLSGEIADEVKSLEKDLESLVDDAKEEMRGQWSDEMETSLEDPIEYFVNEQGMYSMEDLMQCSFIRIDEDEASIDAVNQDGVAHFLDRCDGEEEEWTDPETNDTFYFYGTN